MAQFENAYTRDHEVRDDGSVTFACSSDREAWPWLALGPHHPVTLQAQNFWTSVGAILALGRMEEGKWSALTWTEWTCGDPGVGDAARGTYGREEDEKGELFVTHLFDTDDRLIVTMRGRGVVFRTRNFEDWRGKAKREAVQGANNDLFAFAPRESLGISDSEFPLVGAAQDGGTYPALVSPENGLPPANPMLGGSGDHVNTVHMIEAARQVLCIARERSDLAFIGGEMTMNRYVELGTPFELVLSDSGEQADFTLRQLDRDCARFTLRLRA